MDGYNVYVLQSIDSEDKLYVGIAKSVKDRLKEHNRGKSKYTKAFKPWKVVFEEYVGEAKEARKFEKYYNN